MKTSLLRLVLPALFAAGLVNSPGAHAAPENKGDSDGAFTFTLLPKSFQSKPKIDMTVFTTVTAAGRLVAPALPAPAEVEVPGLSRSSRVLCRPVRWLP